MKRRRVDMDRERGIRVGDRRQIAVEHDREGIDVKAAPINIDRTLCLTRGVQRRTQVLIGGNQIRLDLERSPVCADLVGGAAQRIIRDAEVILRSGVVRIKPRREFENSESARGVALLTVCRSEEDQRAQKLRIDSERCGVFIGRLSEPAF